MSLLRGCYDLPGSTHDVHVIPVSGGIDSTALAILMGRAFPEVSFRYVFTDTLAESSSLYAALDRLEQYLGMKIERIRPEKGLHELIRESQFLPNAGARWCTRKLKIEPFDRWVHLNQPILGRIWSYVGIRADEPWRTAMLSSEPWFETELPLKAWGIRREDVFRIVSETVGVPQFYAQGKSRSGCHSCWGMRRSEVVQLYLGCPGEFAAGGSLEKLTADDLARCREYVEVGREVGLAENWLSYPVPARVDARTADTSEAVDLAAASRVARQRGRRLLWVGVEFRVHSGVGDHGVWWQQFVSWGANLASIRKQLQGWWELRMRTAEALYMTQEEVASEMKLAIYCIDVPAGTLDLSGPTDGSFTWQKGVSYDLVKRAVQYARRSLQAAYLESEAEDLFRRGKTDAAAETIARLAGIQEAVGEVIACDLFEPAPPQSEEEFDEEVAMCAACSI